MDVSVEDCTAADRLKPILHGHIGEFTICFIVPNGFEADGLRFSESSSFNNVDHYHVIPFHDESVYCFVEWADTCNKNNIQPIDGTSAPVPRPEPVPDPEPEPATLLHTIYNNHTGTLTLVFDQLVVAHNLDRIHLIHDIDGFIESGEAPGLGDAELHTVDNKRQSAVLAFKLSDVMRLEVMESLRTHGDLALLIDTRAIYAAEGFVDITRPDNSILVLDIMVLR